MFKDLFAAQFVAAVDQRDFGREVGQEQCFFNSGVSAADDRNFHATVKEPVAGRTGRYAEAFEFLFCWQPKPFCPRTCAHDHSVCRVDGAAVGLRCEWPLGQVERCDDVADNVAAHGACVCFHPDHQVGTLDFGVAGPVFDFGGRGQLPARFNALHKQGFQHGARSIDASGVTCGAGADDQNFGVASDRHDGAFL